MKRTIALTLITVMFIFILASCGNNLSGEYVAEDESSEMFYKFDGNKITIPVGYSDTGSSSGYIGVFTISGTYKIKSDKILITLGDSESEHTFKKDGNKITIDGDVFVKK